MLQLESSEVLISSSSTFDKEPEVIFSSFSLYPALIKDNRVATTYESQAVHSSADPSCSWAGVFWSGVCSAVLVSVFPYIVQSSLNIEGLCQLCCLGGSPSLQHYSQSCLLLDPHYQCLVSFSVQSYCFLSLKTKISVLLGQRPLNSALLWRWEEETFPLLLLYRQNNFDVSQKLAKRMYILYTYHTYDKYFL